MAHERYPLARKRGSASWASSFFFGLAFEEYFGPASERIPGGVRTFPRSPAPTGAMLYLLDPAHAIAFSAGLLGLGAWLFAYYRACLGEPTSPDSTKAGLVAPISNVLAYLLGPIVLLEAHWLAVGMTVSAVLILHVRIPFFISWLDNPGVRDHHLGQLILIGVILPLLPDHPLTSLTTITPYQVWLAVVVVSTLSYGSYLAQRLLSPERGVLLTAVLGGLYSSTATTVALARRMRNDPEARGEFQAGVILATALMYLRLLILFAVFSLVPRGERVGGESPDVVCWCADPGGPVVLVCRTGHGAAARGTSLKPVRVTGGPAVRRDVCGDLGCLILDQTRIRSHGSVLARQPCGVDRY